MQGPLAGKHILCMCMGLWLSCQLGAAKDVLRNKARNATVFAFSCDLEWQLTTESVGPYGGPEIRALWGHDSDVDPFGVWSMDHGCLFGCPGFWVPAFRSCARHADGPSRMMAPHPFWEASVLLSSNRATQR